MQTIGHLKINNQTILILVRQKKYTRALKLRKGGRLGVCFVDESIFLKNKPTLLEMLQNGEVISV